MNIKDKINEMKTENIDSKKSDNSDSLTEKKTFKSRFSRAMRIIAAILLVGIILGCVGCCIVTGWVFDIITDDSQFINLDTEKLKYTTIFYATDSETGAVYELSRYSDPTEGSRIWVDYDEMPECLINALVSVEDKNFWTHPGFDFLTTVKATVNAVLQKIGFTGFYGGETPGASSITQQVVRNTNNDREESWQRKLREIFNAINLEKHYSKEQIIETYLNLVAFSRNCNGIEAAANFFFNKTTSELTAAECASIIGTTKAPNAYDPYWHYEENQARKEYILGLMYEQDYLTKDEYEEALAEKVVFSDENEEASYDQNQSYFMDYVMEEVINDMADTYGLSYAEAESELFGGGYRIYTTVDGRIQEILETVYTNPEEYMPEVLNDEYPQSAFVITDTNGAVKGIVGGVGEKEGARVWNRASDTARQPGSTIKPITGYVLGIENKLINWSTLIEDYAVTIDPDPITHSQPLWTPKNSDNKYRGFVTVVYALQRSLNTIAVQLCQMLTPEVEYDFLTQKLKMSTIVESDIGYSPMSLGSLTNGVKLIDMAGAYQMYSNGGTRTDPYSYTKVLNSDGEVVLENTGTPTRVISFETATIMNKLLQQNVQGVGTGYFARLDEMPCGGKTGTTDDDVDQWFIGVTPYYVGVCWMGYDSRVVLNEDGTVKLDASGNSIPNTIYYSSGSAYPPPILWKTVMEMVHEGLEVKDFPASTNVVSMEYCTETGYAACSKCKETAIGWYTVDNMPTECPEHGDNSSRISYHKVGEQTTRAAD